MVELYRQRNELMDKKMVSQKRRLSGSEDDLKWLWSEYKKIIKDTYGKYSEDFKELIDSERIELVKDAFMSGIKASVTIQDKRLMYDSASRLIKMHESDM